MNFMHDSFTKLQPGNGRYQDLVENTNIVCSCNCTVIADIKATENTAFIDTMSGGYLLNPCTQK